MSRQHKLIARVDIHLNDAILRNMDTFLAYLAKEAGDPDMANLTYKVAGLNPDGTIQILVEGDVPSPDYIE